MSCTIILQSTTGIEASWKASWQVLPATRPEQSFHSANLIFERDTLPTVFSFHPDRLHCYLVTTGGRVEVEAAPDFLVDALEATTTSGSGKTAVTLLAPAHNGNLILADIFRQRMQDLEYIEKVVTLAEPLQPYDGQVWPSTAGLLELVKGSAGAIRMRASSLPISDSDWIPETLTLLQNELYNRLPRPLAVPDLRRRTLAFLEGSGMLPDTGGCATQFYSAARSLGVDVVVLGAPGHWIQGPEYRHWCKEFIPIEFGHDAGFASRIVAALRQSSTPVEALLTTFDSYHVAVSQAAGELGLPHEPTGAYEIATDKFRLSAFEGRTCFRATGIPNLIDTALTKALPWPVIVKPCRGWGSELVFRAANSQQLITWANSINTASSHGTEFLIEPYCDGPEVDINFAMYGGEVLFWEIGDENPKTADDGSDSFHELDCVSPSELSGKEQHLLRDSITDSLLRLGFRNGIYHCEARVAHSTHEWSTTKSGSPILVPCSEPSPRSASCFLMDCNIRPPGLNSSDVVETTWGVDYWALLIAIPLREEQRVRALAQPYRQGPQYFADMIFVSAVFDSSKEGTWQSGNVTEELKARRPDLAKHISKALTYVKKGERIPHPSTGTNTFVAYLNIFSRESRDHVLDIATEVRREITDSILIS